MTCKECVYAIPNNDMQGYECELDHGLRYGYDGCDAEELKAKVTEALPALCDLAADDARIRTLMIALRAVCEGAGFEIAARVVLRDKESGRIYK